MRSLRPRQIQSARSGVAGLSATDDEDEMDDDDEVEEDEDSLVGRGQITDDESDLDEVGMLLLPGLCYHVSYRVD